MSSLLRSLIGKLGEIFEGESSKRRKKLFKIIDPEISYWTLYYQIADIVKKVAPEMYEWGEGSGKYLSPTFMNDLHALFSDGYIKKTRNYKKSPSDIFGLAYRTKKPGIRINLIANLSR